MTDNQTASTPNSNGPAEPLETPMGLFECGICQFPYATPEEAIDCVTSHAPIDEC